MRRLALWSGLCLLVLLSVLFLVGGPVDTRPSALPDSGPGTAVEGGRALAAGEEDSSGPLLATQPEALREADGPEVQDRPAAPDERSEAGEVRWQTRHTDALTRLDVRLSAAESAREEWKDVPRSRFFASMIGRSQALPPLWKGAVEPDRIESETRFYAVEGLLAGHYLLRLEDTARRFFVARVRVDRGGCTDLGLVELEGRSLRVRAVDGAGNPVPEATCLLFFEEWVLAESRTGADGAVFLDPGLGTAVECRKPGFEAGRSRIDDLSEIVVTLLPAPSQTITGPPGSWIFCRQDYWGAVGADGLFQVPKREGYWEFLLVDPQDWSWRLRPYEDGQPIAGDADCAFTVCSRGAPVGAGSIVLHGAGRTFAASLEAGTARFEGLPPGRYGVAFRFGEQVHDNAHVYRFPAVDLEAGIRAFNYQVPDLSLRLRVLGPDRSGLAVPVRISAMGADAVSGARAMIASAGFTDHAGEVVFACLPRLLFMVSIQGRKYHFTPVEEWIEVSVR